MDKLVESITYPLCSKTEGRIPDLPNKESPKTVHIPVQTSQFSWEKAREKGKNKTKTKLIKMVYKYLSNKHMES